VLSRELPAAPSCLVDESRGNQDETSLNLSTRFEVLAISWTKRKEEVRKPTLDSGVSDL